METKVIKITNPLFVGEIAPLIQNFFARVTKNNQWHGISYETIYTYLTNIVQFGGETNELWVAFLDSKPIAFAAFRLCLVPHFGKVSCDYLFKTVKEHEPATLLGKEFIKFGEKHKAPYYVFEAIDESQAKLFKKRLRDVGVEMKETSIIHLIGRKIDE